MKTYKNSENHSSRMFGGIIVLVIGVVFLLSNFGIKMPHWLFSWHTLLIVIGLIIGAKRNFTGKAWLIMVLIGGYFTLQDITDFNLARFYFPIAFIALGLYLILKPKRINGDQWKKKAAAFNITDENPVEEADVSGADYVETVDIFGGSKHNVFSKNFKGADIVAVFGGCELDLTNADFKDTVTLDVVAIFGGAKIIVPPSWEVKSEVTSIFGGVDDKRKILPLAGQERKIIKIKGLALFGGLNITNY